MQPIHRLAIVNRGEAAMRALHAAAEYSREQGLDITTVALATRPDRRAWFAREADEVIDLGPALTPGPDGRSRHTYLDIDLLEQRLVDAEVDAVWVGWGFVAESAEFAAMCERVGITFVGPRSDVIRRVGDKVAAKRLAEEAGVTVVPWSGGPVETVEEAEEAAHELGFPLLVKAAAGGGGRGIRRVDEPAGLGEAFSAARAEAAHAFGDATVFLERVVSAARHVEVQVIADMHGVVWPVGVRDCTVQRRNQKVVEESASTALSPEQDQRLRDAAAAICGSAGYHGAATVEFLWDPDAGESHFMEVNARLQVEHPVTEMTTGLDLVKLQLHVARGGALEGEPPAARGHAVEVRLNAEDPGRAFSPAPGLVAELRLPSGPGIRVDTGIVRGDSIAPEFDSMVAKIIAWGGDRDEALARLRRALAETVAVIDGGTTNKSFLLHLLDRPEMQSGDVHTRWLDELTAQGEHLPVHHGTCLVAAAVEAYEVEHAAARAAFLASAARGRPEVEDETGRTIDLRFAGSSYRLHVHMLTPGTYRVELDDDRRVDVEVDLLGPYERRLRAGGRIHRVLADVQGPTYRIEVDGVPHRIERDDGGLVRSPAPAVVIRLLVGPGDVVATGDPVAVLESMKMESTITAPFAGVVREVHVTTHDQVDTQDPLLTVASAGEEDSDDTARIEVRPDGAVTDDRLADPLSTLHHFVLGFDLDAEGVAQLREGVAPAERDEDAVRAEVTALRRFADIGALARRQPPSDPDEEILQATSPREHMIGYLRSIDRGEEAIPPEFATKLRRALAHYGVDGLERTPELDDALLWMYRAFERLDTTAETIQRVLERWFDEGAGDLGTDEIRRLMDRVLEAAELRYPIVADLARNVRFQVVEAPLLRRMREDVHAEVRGVLDALAATTDEEARTRLLGVAVDCPLPLRSLLLPRAIEGSEEAQRVALIVRTRRYYRIRDLSGPIRTVTVGGRPVAVTSYEREGRQLVLAVAYGEDVAETISAATTAAGDGSEPVIIDVAVRSDQAQPSADELAAEVVEVLDGVDHRREVHRVDVDVTFAGTGDSGDRTIHVTFRPDGGGGFAEDALYRNLHPMLAKRIGLWRLSEFDVERLSSVEDVFLFRAVARDQPSDVRLVAIAEVRDLTPILEEGRVVSLPLLERQLQESLSAIRDHAATLPPRARPQNNRVMLFVRPLLTLSPETWRELAHSLAPATAGLGLEKVVVHAAVPGEDGPVPTVLHIEHVASSGVVVRQEPPAARPISPLSPFRQRVLRTASRGSVHPYELARLLSPPADSESDFPPGEFVEHDLTDDGALAPVERPPGQNTANLVVGTLTNESPTIPEGMRRVVILGDPSRSLGSLAEAECRRIVAAIDLAEAEQLPVEWFAVSSGARISKDSGTENMDWIGAVLRRLIEFTQAGGEVNVVVTGINVGAQPYWNAEATMLMHTRGVLIMTPQSAMVLTGKQALDFSGGVSAEDNFGIGGFERIMGPNGQGQYWAPTLEAACRTLLRHYEHTYVVPGERYPRRAPTEDPIDRDVRTAPHREIPGSPFTSVGDVFSAERNPERKQPFDMRSVMDAVRDSDHEPLERWRAWQDAETVIVWDARIGGHAVSLLGIESHAVTRVGVAPADGPERWTSGTFFPQSSKKMARALNAATGNRPVVVLANLSGFDGSPESMRDRQLEFGAEIGRAVTNFDGPIVFVVVSRYHGGAFVVFSQTLNDELQIAAVEGSYASVIGGTPAAAVVFAREVRDRTNADPRVAEKREQLAAASDADRGELRSELDRLVDNVHSEMIGRVAAEFDSIHSIERALEVGSVDAIIAADELRPWIVEALERGIARTGG